MGLSEPREASAFGAVICPIDGALPPRHYIRTRPQVNRPNPRSFFAIYRLCYTEGLKERSWPTSAGKRALGRLLHLLIRDVEVRVDVRHVVQVLDRFHQAE